MGLTQHVKGVETVRCWSNLLLLRGNIGKPGAGICPVRGHSNVQGQRTVGITEKPELAPLDRLAEQYGFTPPREQGMNTVETCEAILEGRLKAFIGLGGNFMRAVPAGTQWRRHGAGSPHRSDRDQAQSQPCRAWPGEPIILPCLGRTEIDKQASGPQTVSMEDSTACIHGSRGRRDLQACI